MAIDSRDYGTAVCKAMGVDPNKVRRVVIDARAGEPLRVYIEFSGGPELIDVSLPQADIEVKIANVKVE